MFPSARESNATSNRTRVIKIPRYSFKQSKNNSRHQSMKTRKQINNVIHVTIGLSKDNHRHSLPISTNTDYYQQQPIHNKSSSGQNLAQFLKNTSDSVSITNISRRHHSLSQVTTDFRESFDLPTVRNNSSQLNRIRTLSSSNKVVPQQNIRSDDTGVIDDFHRDLKRNKKKKRQRIIALIIIALIIAMIITIVLLVLLIKPQSKTTTPNRIPLLRWNRSGITLAGISGMPGVNGSMLSKPWDLELDYSNTLYIDDTENHRIQKYLFNTLNGTTIAGVTTGIPGSNSSELKYPRRILLDSNNGIYIADSNNERIQYWTIGDTSGETVAGTGVTGNTNKTFSNPYGLACNFNGETLYITDYYNNRVMAYQLGASSGTVAAGGNGMGINNTQLKNPVGIYFDSFSNSLIISNYMAHNIVSWTLGQNSWTLVVGNKNGNSGNNATQLNQPASVTFDPMGNMYVADRGNHRIQLFMLGQSEGLTIAGITSVFGSNSTLLYNPCSVKLDNQLNLYVADTFNHRIQKFLRY